MLVIQATEAQPPKAREQKSIQIKRNIGSFVQSHNFLHHWHNVNQKRLKLCKNDFKS